MGNLSVSTYDKNELDACAKIPNRVIEAFQPRIFASIGYPHRIRRESEVVRFIDAMQECLFEPYLNQILEKITPSEFDLMQRLIGRVLDFTEQQFGVMKIPRSTIMQSMNIIRHVKFIFGDARPKVFEFGPGSGMLGGLLLLDGYHYAATDVTQSFYFVQSHLWQFITENKIKEFAEMPAFQTGPWEFGQYAGIHLPWWEIASRNPQSAPQFDVVTCNHAVCEMSAASLKYSLLLAKQMLRTESNSPKVFLFQGWGLSGKPERAAVCEAFYRAGFALVHHDSKIAVFAPYDAPYAHGYLELPKQETNFAPIEFINPENAISQRILSGRELQREDQVVGTEQINTLFTALLGSEDHRSEDERFYDLIDYEVIIGSQTP